MGPLLLPTISNRVLLEALVGTAILTIIRPSCPVFGVHFSLLSLENRDLATRGRSLISRARLLGARLAFQESIPTQV